jgi:hypothetical protein
LPRDWLSAGAPVMPFAYHGYRSLLFSLPTNEGGFVFWKQVGTKRTQTIAFNSLQKKIAR